ncbi:hypothetical protein [Acidithiobacillus ferriphilus]|uniref:hypothetical protein n=1 Tax=Acidithiobacillus ferriphilus TaxID=1689834 RepID=UPI001C0748BB|nr:hypothetical protein [Acidithiobacillus ferriphilus]MBU2853005.1 hypothetical protein [Acidithiobacillus ferriphilus]
MANYDYTDSKTLEYATKFIVKGVLYVDNYEGNYEGNVGDSEIADQEHLPFNQFEWLKNEKRIPKQEDIYPASCAAVIEAEIDSEDLLQGQSLEYRHYAIDDAEEPAFEKYILLKTDGQKVDMHVEDYNQPAQPIKEVLADFLSNTEDTKALRDSVVQYVTPHVNNVQWKSLANQLLSPDDLQVFIENTTDMVKTHLCESIKTANLMAVGGQEVNSEKAYPVQSPAVKYQEIESLKHLAKANEAAEAYLRNTPFDVDERQLQKMYTEAKKEATKAFIAFDKCPEFRPELKALLGKSLDPADIDKERNTGRSR